MMTKIKWFKEVLELEPSSKVFFPLARLYFDDGNYADAMSTLRHGLDRNPDHLEARFMLVEILVRLERHEEATAEVHTITGMLSRYPSFWKVWAEHAAPTSKDSAMALTFLAANFQGSPISWSQVIEKGLDALFLGNGGDVAADKPKKKRTVRKAETETDPNIRTRTMADLLADQGDFQGALAIYEELADRVAGHEAMELEALIEKMRVKLKKGVPEPDAQPMDDVAVALEPGLEDDLEFEPSGGTQPMDVPDFEDEHDFDAQAMLEEMLAGGDDEEEEGFEAEVATAPEPEFEALDDVDLGDLDGVNLDDLDDVDLDDLEEMDLEALTETEGELELAEPEFEAEDEEPEEVLEEPSSGKEQLLQTLDALADRLEARALG